MKQKSKYAVIVLHEIYGVNLFIKEICQKYEKIGFDVFCPNMISRKPFSYEERNQAYNFFINNIGFDYSRVISDTIVKLKENYEKVFLIGFSVGATIAWKCCQNQFCDGIVGCYGSRIRDYEYLNPVCNTLLLFSKYDLFNVDELVLNLKDKKYLKTRIFDAKHGFMDCYSENYNEITEKYANKLILDFFKENK